MTYSNWFKDIGNKIHELDYKHTTIAGRLIKKIIQALDDIEVYEPIETNIQILDFIRKTKEHLMHMIWSVNVKKSHLVSIDTISDFSYSWKIIDHYLLIMQNRIKEKPSTVLYQKSVFLKLASIMNNPLVRIIEAMSGDIDNVAQYYSSELVKFVK